MDGTSRRIQRRPGIASQADRVAGRQGETVCAIGETDRTHAHGKIGWNEQTERVTDHAYAHARARERKRAGGGQMYRTGRAGG